MAHPRLPARTAAVLLAILPALAAADEPDLVGKALAKPILGARQTLAEVADHCEPRVPKMPAVTTREAWEAYAEKTRAAARERVLFRGEAAAWRDAKVRVEWLDRVETGPGYRLRKLRYEAVPGLWIPALLYEPDDIDKRGKVPVVLNVNGHDAKGKAADYKQIRCVNQARRGTVALNVEWLGMGQLADGNNRHDLINHLDLCGTSGVATHFLAMAKALDVLLAHDHADPARVAVTGLSGGGWQTIFFTAFEPRVTLANPVAGYSSFVTRSRRFSDLGDSEQTPVDLATVTDYAVMTALVAPRPLLLTYNAKDDCCFAAGHALPPLLEAAGPVYTLFGQASRLRSHINEDPGTHNYGLDNRQALYRMLGEFFFAGDASYDAKEVPAESEVKGRDVLDVPLPDGNKGLHRLAVELSRSLPRDGALPADADAARAWREARRGKLRETLRLPRHEVQVRSQDSVLEAGLHSTSWRLTIGDWSVPVVELWRANSPPKGTALLLADAGRKAVAAEARRRLDAGMRVVAVDPFYVGESKVAEKDYLFALLLSAVGDRPLGVQASQLGAVARWVAGPRKDGPLTIVADGPRTSVMALAVSALEPDSVAAVEVRGSHGSLKELIEAKSTFNSAPELFCFGLLQDFDVAHLAALSAPRPVTFHAPSARARTELAGLAGWYKVWGVPHEPLK